MINQKENRPPETTPFIVAVLNGLLLTVALYTIVATLEVCCIRESAAVLVDLPANDSAEVADSISFLLSCCGGCVLPAILA